MPFVSHRPTLVLSEQDERELNRIASARNEAHSRVTRARVLLAYAQKEPISSIARNFRVTRPLVERCVDKALSGGISVALADLPRAGRPPEITAEAKAWVVNLACSKPTEHGYAAELWTYRQLSEHVRSQCQQAGHSSLVRAGKSAVHSILAEHPVRPHKFNYYLERRDPEFESKMAQVLFVYHEVEAINSAQQADSEPRTHTTISYDEKPGIQAIARVAPDLMPVPGKHPTIARDYEYKRKGTVSLLGGIDLHTGHVIGLVRDHHRSKEFTEFLETVDAHYPDDWRLRIILDNHSAHISKETMAWLKKHPGRFEFVFTPKHGSWLNLIEVFFSKMTRAFLRGIRVDSKDELVTRIEKYIDEVNAAPVIFRWRYKLYDAIV